MRLVEGVTTIHFSVPPRTSTTNRPRSSNRTSATDANGPPMKPSTRHAQSSCRRCRNRRSSARPALQPPPINRAEVVVEVVAAASPRTSSRFHRCWPQTRRAMDRPWTCGGRKRSVRMRQTTMSTILYAIIWITCSERRAPRGLHRRSKRPG